MKEQHMLPPWIMYPEIPRASIGWRMGYGESYMIEFSQWFNKLSPASQADYEKLFPKPILWKDGHSFKHNDWWIDLWREDGKAKYDRPWASQAYTAGEKLEFCFFYGHQPAEDGAISKSCLSQWWMSDFHKGHRAYCCMEQYMMAGKAEIFADKDMHEQIMASRSPKEIKALGRKVKNFQEDVWNKVKHTIVLTGNYYKFTQNEALLHFLLNTKGILVEASPRDQVWGIGMGENNPNSTNPTKWRGRNLLGFALTELREELARVYKWKFLE